MTAPFIRTQYNMDAKHNSDYTGITFLDKSLTQQQFKDMADINIIFGKYLETNEIPQVEGMAYGDFTGIFDFQSAMNAVRKAQESFQELPARIKNRFDNDPQKMLAFLNDPENREEAEFLKIVQPKETIDGPTSQSLPTGGTNPTARASGASGNAPEGEGPEGSRPQDARPDRSRDRRPRRQDPDVE